MKKKVINNLVQKHLFEFNKPKIEPSKKLYNRNVKNSKSSLEDYLIIFI
jgi:hypothetical protein